MPDHRALLLAKRADLLSRLARREGIEVERFADQLDQSVQLTERERAAGELEHDRKLLRQVEAAIERIEDGTFGTCADCGDPIESRRLAAVPWVERCHGCQEMREMAERYERETRRAYA